MADRDLKQRAEDKLDETLAPEHHRRHADGDGPVTDTASLRREQLREGDELVGVPTVPVMTTPMRRGMFGGAVLGGLIGALIAFPIAFLVLAGESLAVRLVVVIGIGFTAGATAGAVYFGGRAPELSGESFDADGRPSAGSSLRDPRTDARGR